MQRVTTYGDETVMTAQAMLLTFTKIGKETFPDALEATLNVATAMGTDLKSAALQVGKALNDPVQGITALTRAGIQFTDGQKDVIKELVETGRTAEAQRMILGELETQMGGAARAARNTLGGAIAGLKNAFGDLLEGDSGGDGVRGTTDAINQLTDTMNSSEVKAGFQSIVQGILSVIGAAARGISELVSFTRWVGEAAAARISGPALGDIVRISDALEKQREKVEMLTRARDAARTTVRRNNLTQQIQEEQAELEKLQGMLKLSEEMAASASRSLEVPAATMTGVLVPAVDAVTESNNRGANAARNATEAVQRQVDALVLQAETFNMTETEATLYRLSLEQGVTPAQLATARAALETVDALRQEAEASREAAAAKAELERAGVAYYESTRTAAENLGAELARLQELLDAKVITWDTYARAVFGAEEKFDSLKEKVPEVADELDRFRATAAERLQGVFADALTDPFSGSLEEMRRKWSQMLQRMAAEALAAKLTEALFGKGTGGGGFLASLGGFFGFKSIGGNIPAGGYAVAGDKGRPEIVKGPATVVSGEDTAKMAGGGRSIRIINAFDPSVLGDWLGSTSGEEMVMNIVRRNQPSYSEV
jgi:hypothetical protein